MMDSSQEVIKASKGTNQLGSKVKSASTPYYEDHHITPHFQAVGEDGQGNKNICEVSMWPAASVSMWYELKLLGFSIYVLMMDISKMR